MKSLRVISGTARGQRLRSVPGDKTRPITDRVKEALFNIICSDIVSASLLDLFAGTGAVGIEALSRGAEYVRFVDTQTQAIRTIKANLIQTNLSEKTIVIRHDAFKLLASTPDRAYDYIYVAPPQYKGLWSKSMRLLEQNIEWLDKDGWGIIQIDPIEYQEIQLSKLVEFDQRRYGSTQLIFFNRSD
jgi:16S rRNA (guanine(966)-N(2))-methyltransferase RsmD